MENRSVPRPDPYLLELYTLGWWAHCGLLWGIFQWSMTFSILHVQFEWVGSFHLPHHTGTACLHQHQGVFVLLPWYLEVFWLPIGCHILTSSSDAQSWVILTKTKSFMFLSLCILACYHVNKYWPICYYNSNNIWTLSVAVSILEILPFTPTLKPGYPLQ